MSPSSVTNRWDDTTSTPPTVVGHRAEAVEPGHQHEVGRDADELADHLRRERAAPFPVRLVDPVEPPPRAGRPRSREGCRCRRRRRSRGRARAAGSRRCCRHAGWFRPRVRAEHQHPDHAVLRSRRSWRVSTRVRLIVAGWTVASGTTRATTASSSASRAPRPGGPSSRAPPPRRVSPSSVATSYPKTDQAPSSSTSISRPRRLKGRSSPSTVASKAKRTDAVAPTTSESSHEEGEVGVRAGSRAPTRRRRSGSRSAGRCRLPRSAPGRR